MWIIRRSDPKLLEYKKGEVITKSSKKFFVFSYLRKSKFTIESTVKS